MTDERSPPDGPARALTRAEREVCECVARGWGYARIAAWLGITKATARVHVANIAGKLPPEDVRPYQRVFLWLQRQKWERDRPQPRSA